MSQVYPHEPPLSSLFHMRMEICHRVQEELRHREKVKTQYDWSLQAREKQRPPFGEWRVWLVLAGRGFGKTRTGSETLRQWVKENKARRIALLGATAEEARHIMVEGISGLLTVHPPEERPLYEPSNRRLIWPNGAVAYLYSGDRYDQLRGPQFDCAWIDELAKFRYAEQAWTQLNFCLRLGDAPRVIITTTPRPIPLLRDLVSRAFIADHRRVVGEEEEPPVSLQTLKVSLAPQPLKGRNGSFEKAFPEKRIVLTQGTTFENRDYLSQAFLETIQDQYQGTRLGRQELWGEFLSPQSHTLWTPQMLEAQRISEVPFLRRVVVAIDPAVTHHRTSDETAIIVAGRDEGGHGYVLQDLSGRCDATEWARRAVAAYHHHRADRIIAEVNQGGDLVEKMIRLHDPQVSYKGVRARRGKRVRAEPIAALYEQGKVYHWEGAGSLQTLETQLCAYCPETQEKSPDRLDALVWALTELLLPPEIKRKGQIWKL